MSLKNLTKYEQNIVFHCLKAAAEGPFFPGWEFHPLLGLSQEEVQKVIQRWPVDDNTDEVAALAINNSLGNLIGYPHERYDVWEDYIPASREEVRKIFIKWRGEKLK